MTAAAPYNSSPRCVLSKDIGNVEGLSLCVVLSFQQTNIWRVQLCVSHHQEYAAPATPACSRSELCDKETSSSRYPSTHLSNAIRITALFKFKNRGVRLFIRQSMRVFVCVCLEGYRINISKRVCCSLLSSGKR